MPIIPLNASIKVSLVLRELTADISDTNKVVKTNNMVPMVFLVDLNIGETEFPIILNKETGYAPCNSTA